MPPSVPAVVNYGRWIVRCPACPSARLVTPGEQAFVCLSEQPPCPAFGVRSEIVWPSELREIERLLSHRPRLRNRNWEWWEPLSELRRQNRNHDCEV